LVGGISLVFKFDKCGISTFMIHLDAIAKRNTEEDKKNKLWKWNHQKMLSFH